MQLPEDETDLIQSRQTVATYQAELTAARQALNLKTQQLESLETQSQVLEAASLALTTEDINRYQANLEATIAAEQAVQTLLQNYADEANSDDAVEAQLSFDRDRGHYQLVYIGWEGNRRVYGCVLHFDIKGDKIWIQHNDTEVDVAAKLVELGVPPTQIVIGFHSLFKRQFTDYAVG